MVYVYAGSLLGLGMLSIFQSILWLYHDIKLTNLTLVISHMGSLGFPVGNNFNCGCCQYSYIFYYLQLYFLTWIQVVVLVSLFQYPTIGYHDVPRPESL